MQTSSPAGGRLRELRNELIHFHKALLDSERGVYERDVERVASSGRMLQLVMSDPYFAWLHKVSELIVAIDERLDEDEPATPADADRFVGVTRTLLVPAENGEEFGRRYFEAMQRDPAVVIAHGRMMGVLNSVGQGRS
jgi:hypothetical protein